MFMSVILDVTQEHQAQHAADSLRKQVSLSAKVLRDGQPADVPAAEIVPGDIVLLAAGDLVPSDARLIEARDLRRVSLDANTGDLHHSHGHPLQGSATCSAGGKFALSLYFGNGASLFTAGALVRLRSAAGRSHGRARARDPRLSRRRLWPKALVPCALQVDLS